MLHWNPLSKLYVLFFLIRLASNLNSGEKENSSPNVPVSADQRYLKLWLRKYCWSSWVFSFSTTKTFKLGDAVFFKNKPSSTKWPGKVVETQDSIVGLSKPPGNNHCIYFGSNNYQYALASKLELIDSNDVINVPKSVSKGLTKAYFELNMYLKN